MNNEDKTIEELCEDYKVLNDSKVRAEQDLKNAEKTLNELKTEAQKEFGTDDIKKLEDKLNEIETKNEQKRKEYQEVIEEIEARLKEVGKEAESDEPSDEG